MIIKDYATLKKLISKHPVKKLHPTWKQNYLFVKGEQFWQKTQGGVIDNKINIYEERNNVTVRNRLFVIVATWASKFIEKLVPVFSVIPRSTDYEDRIKAKNAQYFARYFWQKSGMKKKLLPAFNWLFIAGNMFLKVFWDKSQWVEVEDPVSGEVKKVNLGDVNFKHVNPFSIYFDPYASDIGEARWVAEVYRVPVSETKLLFGKELQPDKNKSDFVDMWAFDEDTEFMVDGEYEDKNVVVVETWEKTGGKWTKKIWANNSLILEEGEHDFHPYAQAKDKDYGKPYGYTTLEHAIQAQKDYNKAYGFLLDQLQHSLGAILFPSSAEITRERFKGGGIEIIKYTPGVSEPKVLQGMGINPAYINYLMAEQREIEDITGLHAVAQGKLPQGSSHTPGYVFQMLNSSDIARIGAAMVQVEDAISVMLFKAINYAQKNYSDERILRVYGKEEGIRVMRMKGKTIDLADVRVDFASSLPLSKMERIQFIMQLAQAGLLPAQKALEYMELGEMSRAFGDTLRDVKRAERMIDYIYTETSVVRFDEEAVPDPMTGEVNNWYVLDKTGMRVYVKPEDFVPEVEDFDNSQIQLEVIEGEMKTARWENSTEFTKQVFRLLRQEHIDRLTQQQQNLIQQQAQAQQQAQPQPQPQPQEQQYSAEQILGKIIAMLQQGVPPEELIQQGVPQELVQMAVEQLNAGGM